VYKYDWRNRLTDSRGPSNLAVHYTFNNLGEATEVQSYADADQDFVIDSGELRGQSESLYDEQGQVYQTIQYAVDPTNGIIGVRVR
jgi:hypothetical protein